MSLAPASGSAEAALAISGLCVERGGRIVVADFSLSAAAGRITALIGPNGSGKSSALKAALGLIPASAGTVTSAGQDLLGLDPRERARRVAYVPQRSALAAPLRVDEVVAAGRYAHAGWSGAPSADDRAAAERALRDVDAAILSARRFSELSAGEQQRVLVARALATGAPCLLLDEPTAALDVGHALALLRLLRRLADAGRALVVVLHHLDEMRAIADTAVLLHRGAIIASGAVDAVLAPGPLRTAFGVEAVPGGALGFRLTDGVT